PRLGELLILIREAGVDPLEAAFATGVRRFDRSGEYAADGELSVTAWLKWKCKLSGGAAAERVEIGRQLERLPKTEEAFARGDLGYQHVAVIARTAENVGTAAVRTEERILLKAALTMDPGQFTTVAKNFEHRVDAAGALAEATRAYQRRYLHIGEPPDGVIRRIGSRRNGACGNRTALCVRYRTHTNDRPDRARTRAQSGQPYHTGLDAAGARSARPALRLAGLRAARGLVRWTSSRLVDK